MRNLPCDATVVLYARNIPPGRSSLPTPYGSSGQQSLAFGTFYGRLDVRHRTPTLDIALLNADPHRVVERHSHDEAHFVFVVDGLYVSSASGADAVSHGRALIWNPAGTTHRDRFEARSRVMGGRFLTLSIAAELMDGARGDGRALERATALHDARTIALAERIVRECSDGSAKGTLMRESLALSLLAAVTDAQEPRAASPPAWLAIARELLDDRCGDEIGIREVAAAVGVHPVHLARVFRRYFGCSPGEYVRGRRLERGAVLLRETARPISDIALSLGFVDQSHFTTSFSAKMSVTPAAYRLSVPFGSVDRHP